MHQNAAAVTRVWLALQIAAFLQPVEHHRDAARGQPGKAGQLARRRRSDELECVDALHIGEAQAHSVGDLLVVENASRDELPQAADHRLVQLGAV